MRRVLKSAASPALHGDSLPDPGEAQPRLPRLQLPASTFANRNPTAAIFNPPAPPCLGLPPLHPHPLAPTRWHQSVILRTLRQPEGPGGRSGCPGRAGLWGKQNKSVTAQSPNSPTPDSFRTCTSQPALLLPAIQRAAEGEPDFWVEGSSRKNEWAPWDPAPQGAKRKARGIGVPWFFPAVEAREGFAPLKFPHLCLAI